jgi:DNA-directed RNA polymerase subunit RPC12/RpoP
MAMYKCSVCDGLFDDDWDMMDEESRCPSCVEDADEENGDDQ